MTVPWHRLQRRSAREHGWQLAVLGVTAVAVALRSYQLGFHALWYDETFSAWAAAQEPSSILWISLQDAVHPPLYYLLLANWTRLVGNSEFGLRLLSAAVSALGVPLLFQIGQRGWNRPVGLLAALVWACSPFAIWYGQEARMYAILTVVGLAAMASLARALTQRSTACLVVVATLNLIGLYTHYFYVFIVLSQYLYLAFNLRSNRRTFWRWLAVNGVSAALFMPWLVALSRSGLQRAQISWIPPLTFRTLIETLLELSTCPKQPPTAFAWLSIVILACGLGAAATQRRRDHLWQIRGLVRTHLWAPILVVMLISFRTPLFSPRFLQIALPAFLLLSTAGLADVLRPRLGALLALALLLAWLPGLYSMYQMPTRYEQDWSAAMAYLRSRAEPGDTAAFRGGQGWHAYWYYYEGTPLKEVNLLPEDGVDELASKLADSPHVWLIKWDTARDCAPPAELIPNPNDRLQIGTIACFPEVVVTSFSWQAEPG